MVAALFISGGVPNDDDDCAAFRAEVRAFCEARLPEDIRAKVLANHRLDKADHVRWLKILEEKGWFTGHWPVEVGGLGWSAQQRWIFENEIYYLGSPWLIPFGVTYVAPVIYTFGTREQCERFLPGIKTTDDWWCQGYSEPGAGSDLAAVATRAMRDGDDWVVTGGKTWTTTAQWANWIFVIVRTEEATVRQQGLSFMLIDMRSPGVTVRPIMTIDACHSVNEVIFDAVRVPSENVIGEPGRGWSYAKFLLGNERLLGAEIGRCARLLDDLRTMTAQVRSAGRPLSEDRGWRRRMASLKSRTMMLESLARSMLAEQRGGQDPGARASVLKLIGSELSQDIDIALMEVLGHAGLSFQTEALEAGWSGVEVGPPHAAGSLRKYLYGRVSTIYGGSSEVQRNIIAKAVLGL